MEQTLVLIKPDAVRAHHIGDITKAYEEAGLQIRAMKMMQMTDRIARIHYEEHLAKPFYGELSAFMTGAPLVAMVLAGENAIARVKELLFQLQKQLGILMADFASRGQEPMITEEMLQSIEAEITNIEGSLPPLTKFLVPGETKAEAFLDFARTTARMAERRAWSLSRRGTVEDIDLRYLNRISDYLFILMRLENEDIPRR